MSTELPRGAMNLEVLAKLPDHERLGYIRNRVYGVEPLNPPPSRFGEGSLNFLVGASLSPQLGEVLADDYQTLLGELVDKSRQMEPSAQDIVATRHVAMLVSSLPERSLAFTFKTPTMLRELASRWINHDPEDTMTASTEHALLNALVHTPRAGEVSKFWLDLWSDAERPDYWTISFLGLAKAAPEQAITQTGVVLGRTSNRVMFPNWNVESTARALIRAAVEYPDGLKDLARAVKYGVPGRRGQLSRDDRYVMLQQAGISPTIVSLLKDYGIVAFQGWQDDPVEHDEVAGRVSIAVAKQNLELALKNS